MKVTIYTDGAARGNPDGPGGFGTVIHYVDPAGKLHTKEISGGYKRTTNNRMELMAAIAGLEALNRPCEIELYSDSQYLVNAFNQHWIEGWIKKGWKRGKNEEVKNVDLWKRLLAAKEPHQISFFWVKGHNGHPENERCDFLATSAADGDEYSSLLLTYVCPVTGFCRCFAFQIGKICIRNCIVRNFQFRKFLPVSSYYNNPYDMFTSFDHLFSNRLKCAILKLSSEQE